MSVEGFGELVTSRGPVHCREGHEYCAEWVRIERADPRILITRRLVEEWLCFGTGYFVSLREGPGSQTWTLRPQDDDPADMDALFAWIETISREMRGWIVTIRGENRTVLYRLGEYLPGRDCYVAEWPD